MGDYVVVALWQARPETADDVERVLAAMVAPTLGEPGCLEYRVHRAEADPTTFMLYERYVDEAAYRAHQDSEHFETIARGRGIPLLESRTRTTYTDVTPVTPVTPVTGPSAHQSGAVR